MPNRLDPGAVLRRVFTIYGQQAAVLIPAALLLFLPIAALTGAIETGGYRPGAALIAFFLGIIGSVWFQGIVVEAVRDIRDGRRDVSLTELFRAAAPALGPLLLVGLVAGIGVAFGFLLLIVPGLILLTIWAVVAPVVVLERPGVMDAFSRSRELVRGNGWPVFGVLMLLVLLEIAGSTILSAALGNDTFTQSFIGSIITSALIAPLGAIAATVMYYDLRELREGPGAHIQAPPSLHEQPLSERPAESAPPPATSGGWVPPQPAAPAPERQEPPGNLPTE
jgi:hypothetical protein